MVANFRDVFLGDTMRVRGWRKKLMVFLIVYFAGFATAIYMLVPGSANLAEAQGRSSPKSKGFATSVLKSDDFARWFRVKMDRCLDLGCDASKRIADSLNEKFSGGNESSDG